jgi:hypothetical protein
MVDPLQSPPLDVHGHTPLPDEEPAPMSEAYRDRGPDLVGRLDLIERALAQMIATLERIERRLPGGNAGSERQPS